MLQRKKYELRRGGKVKLKVWGPNHCGPDPDSHGMITLRYLVELAATGKLDEKGFLIDNRFVNEWMVQRCHIGSDLSCELLCDELERQLKDAMCEAEPSLQLLSFSLTLSPDFGPDQVMSLKTFATDIHSHTDGEWE